MCTRSRTLKKGMSLKTNIHSEVEEVHHDMQRWRS